MKCSVYISEMKVAECDLLPADDSMCVAHAHINITFDETEFSKTLHDHGAKNNDGVIELLHRNGLRILDDTGSLIPSVGSVIMYCPELNRTELDVYGIDAKYYKNRLHRVGIDSPGLA